jgi:hypothetical protein
MAEVVSGVGADSKRTDNNISERVSKIQREAKMQNASGGSYGERANLASLAGAAPTNVQSAGLRSPQAQGQPLNPSQLPDSSVFAPGTPGVPLSQGAPGGPGAGTEVLQTPVDAIDQTSVLLRAMYMANPTPQLRRMVEAFNEEGR